MKRRFRYGMETIDEYASDKEYTANLYVMRCFFISMLVYGVAFLLNYFDIFIVDKKIMLMGFVPSIFIYAVMAVVTRIISLSSEKIKYFLLFSIVLVFTLIGVTITYHVVIIAVLPILYAILYSSKKVMWYVYGLTVLSTIVIVYAGYYHGLCDANMVLLTITKLENYLLDGQFTLTAVNANPLVTLALYFVIPRCLIYVAFMAVCSNIYTIINSQHKKIKDAYWQTVMALSEAVDAKDRYTSGHSKRVAEYSRLMAARMGKSDKEQETIYQAGLLHDVGKIRIPVDIINKPGKLTDEEYNLVKIHPVTGYHILKDISDQHDMATAAKYHHERFDGRGYPNGIEGESIPEMARILAVADSYDAMTSNRSYRKALPQDVVRDEIEKGKGTQFDADIAEVMIQLIDEDKKYKMRQIDKEEHKILLVGTDAECKRLVSEVLQSSNICGVIQTDDATDAGILEQLENRDFEAVVIDIQAVGEVGWEILRTIKEEYNLPVVVMSDNKNLRSTKEFIESGCDDYLSKPLNPGILNETIYNLIKGY